MTEWNAFFFFAACLARSCATYLLSSSPAITFLQTHREQPAVDEDKLITAKLPFVSLYETDKTNAISVAINTCTPIYVDE